MIIIGEGVDAAGKTSFLNSLCKELDIPLIKKKMEIIHRNEKNWFSDDSIEAVAQMFFESIFPLGRHYDFGLDRGLISSIVYSIIYNRSHSLDYIKEYMSKPEFTDNFILIHVDCHEEILEERFKKRGDPIQSLDIIKKGLSLYRDVFDKLKNENVKVKLFTALNNHPEDIQKNINRFIELWGNSLTNRL